MRLRQRRFRRPRRRLVSELICEKAKRDPTNAANAAERAMWSLEQHMDNDYFFATRVAQNARRRLDRELERDGNAASRAARAAAKLTSSFALRMVDHRARGQCTGRAFLELEFDASFESAFREATNTKRRPSTS